MFSGTMKGNEEIVDGKKFLSSFISYVCASGENLNFRPSLGGEEFNKLWSSSSLCMESFPYFDRPESHESN